MSHATDRLDLRLSAEDKQRIVDAAALHGVPVAAFVRDAALREAASAIDHASRRGTNGLAARLRGRASESMTTEDIMRLTRDA
jgi:uncharacterized protein (DUF1778 family)